MALLITGIAYPRWIGDNWPSDVLAVLPSVLGFSLGGYAMLLAFGDTRFLKFLAGPGRNGTSYLNTVSASFVHFIVVQVGSLVGALSLSGYVSKSQGLLVTCLSGLTYWTFLYALLTALAATFAVFRMTSLYEKFAPVSGDPGGDGN